MRKFVSMAVAVLLVLGGVACERDESGDMNDMDDEMAPMEDMDAEDEM